MCKIYIEDHVAIDWQNHFSILGHSFRPRFVFTQRNGNDWKKNVMGTWKQVQEDEELFEKWLTFGYAFLEIAIATFFGLRSFQFLFQFCRCVRCGVRMCGRFWRVDERLVEVVLQKRMWRWCGPEGSAIAQHARPSQGIDVAGRSKNIPKKRSISYVCVCVCTTMLNNLTNMIKQYTTTSTKSNFIKSFDDYFHFVRYQKFWKILISTSGPLHFIKK